MSRGEEGLTRVHGFTVHGFTSAHLSGVILCLYAPWGDTLEGKETSGNGCYGIRTAIEKKTRCCMRAVL